MKEFFNNSAFKTVAIISIIAAVSIFITFNWFIEFSSFSVGLTKAVLGISLVWIFDKYAVKEIDTIEELKKGNIAYAIFFLGLCVVIASAILTS